LSVVNIAILDGLNINTKQTEKLSKYKDLEMQVSRMWKLRTKIVPIIIEALGTLKRDWIRTVKLLPGHLLALELQITLMSTAHIICKVLRWITLISCWDLDLTEHHHLITY